MLGASTEGAHRRSAGIGSRGASRSVSFYSSSDFARPLQTRWIGRLRAQEVRGPDPALPCDDHRDHDEKGREQDDQGPVCKMLVLAGDNGQAGCIRRLHGPPRIEASRQRARCIRLWLRDRPRPYPATAAPANTAQVPRSPRSGRPIVSPPHRPSSNAGPQLAKGPDVEQQLRSVVAVKADVIRSLLRRMKPAEPSVEPTNGRDPQQHTFDRILSHSGTVVLAPVVKLLGRGSRVVRSARVHDMQVLETCAAVADGRKTLQKNTILLPERVLVLRQTSRTIVELARKHTAPTADGAQLSRTPLTSSVR